MGDQSRQEPASAAQKLRQLLSDPRHTVMAPDIYESTMESPPASPWPRTGAGTSMSRLGMADLGLAAFTDMLQNASMLVGISPATPIVADADTGYGGPIIVAWTVRAYGRAGVAGLHIENQVQEKRCVHLARKLLVSRDVWATRLRAACKARDESGSGMVIIARSDARAGKDVYGNGGWDEAIARLKLAAELGANALFLEALQSPDECQRAIAELPDLPVLLNMVPIGKTSLVSNDEANKLGFRIVIWPTLGLEAVVPAVEGALQHLKRTGKRPDEQAMGPSKLFDMCGLEELKAFDESVGGKAYQ